MHMEQPKVSYIIFYKFSLSLYLLFLVVFPLLHFFLDESEDEYYYDDDNTDEEEQLPNGQTLDDKISSGNDLIESLSSSTKRESEDLLVTLRAENAAVLEEIRMIEVTVRDPVQRFKKIRDLAAKHREIVYNIKKAENPNRNPDQRDSKIATSTTISSEVDTSRLADN